MLHVEPACGLHTVDELELIFTLADLPRYVVSSPGDTHLGTSNPVLFIQ